MTGLDNIIIIMRTFAQCSGDFVTLMMKTREETKAELTGCAGTDWKSPAVIKKTTVEVAKG